MTDDSKEDVQAVAGYDKDGIAQVFQLAPGEKLPKGFSDTPPKGTHPHEREIAAARAAMGVQEDVAPSEDMTKEELIAMAEKYDIEVTHSWTKAQLIDAIEEAQS